MPSREYGFGYRYMYQTHCGGGGGVGRGVIGGGSGGGVEKDGDPRILIHQHFHHPNRSHRPYQNRDLFFSSELENNDSINGVIKIRKLYIYIYIYINFTVPK